MQSYSQSQSQSLQIVKLTKEIKDQLRAALEEADKADISDNEKAQLQILTQELQPILHSRLEFATTSDSFYKNILSKADPLEAIKNPPIVRLVQLLQEAYSEAQTQSGLSR